MSKTPKYYRVGGVVQGSQAPELSYLSHTVDEIDEYLDEGMDSRVANVFKLRINALNSILQVKKDILSFSPEDLALWLSGILRIIRTHVRDPQTMKRIAEDIMSYEVKKVKLPEATGAQYFNPREDISDTITVEPGVDAIYEEVVDEIGEDVQAIEIPEGELDD